MASGDKEVQYSESRASHEKVKFEVYGKELVEKVVKISGNTGRIYLPPDWIGEKVKVVRC